MGQQEIYDFLKENAPKRYTCKQLKQNKILDVNTSTLASLARRLHLWGFVKRDRVKLEGFTRMEYCYWVEVEDE